MKANTCCILETHRGRHVRHVGCQEPTWEWSMRCNGSTLRVFTVPSVGACFELEAEYKLPKRRGPRRAAARRERTDRFDPEENAAREQWAPGRA